MALGAFATAALVLLYGIGASATETLQPASGPKPDFVLSDLVGTDVKLATLRGRIVLVHFFATWCEPCREELPALRRLIERSGAAPVSVLAISVGEVSARVRRFMETMPVDFPVLLDGERAVAKSWDVYALPTTYVLDPELTPKLVSNGEFAWDQLTIGELRAMLAAAPGEQTGTTKNPELGTRQQGG